MVMAGLPLPGWLLLPPPAELLEPPPDAAFLPPLELHAAIVAATATATVPAAMRENSPVRFINFFSLGCPDMDEQTHTRAPVGTVPPSSAASVWPDWFSSVWACAAPARCDWRRPTGVTRRSMSTNRPWTRKASTMTT